MAMIREPSKSIAHVWETTTSTGASDFINTSSTVTVTSPMWSRVISTTSSGGTWSTPLISEEPDMTDWPADDIIDYYAKDLAMRRPA